MEPAGNDSSMPGFVSDDVVIEADKAQDDITATFTDAMPIGLFV